MCADTVLMVVSGVYPQRTHTTLTMSIPHRPHSITPMLWITFDHIVSFRTSCTSYTLSTVSTSAKKALAASHATAQAHTNIKK